jgi:hypothetical protein
MSKRQTTMFNRYSRVLSRVREMWGRIYFNKLSHAEWLELRAPILESEDYKKLTVYYRARISGYDNGRADAQWMYAVEWKFQFDGVELPICYDDCTPEQRAIIAKNDGKNGHHFWKGTARRWS